MTDLGSRLVEFSFRDDVVYAFTNGDCGYLALSIHDMTELPVVTVSAASEAEAWCHVGVALPDGRIVDIEGIWDADSWCARWLSCVWGDTAKVYTWGVDNIRNSIEEEGRVFPSFRVRHWAQKVVALIPTEQKETS